MFAQGPLRVWVPGTEAGCGGPQDTTAEGLFMRDYVRHGTQTDGRDGVSALFLRKCCGFR